MKGARRPGVEQVLESLNLSALVALGVAAEEVLTASFLPLATAHVSRCRRLEEREAEEGGAGSGEDRVGVGRGEEEEEEYSANDEWNLPPEEAVERLSAEEFRAGGRWSRETYLPSAAPPSRPGRSPATSTGSGISNSDNSPSSLSAAARQWCRAHGLDPVVVRGNVDLFGALLPAAPLVVKEESDKDRTECI